MAKRKGRSAAKFSGKTKLILAAAAGVLILLAALSSGGKKKDAPVPTAAPAAAEQRLTVAPVTQLPATQISVTSIPATQAPTSSPTPGPTDIPTLKKGAKGQDVKAMQERLIDLHYLSGTADGDFGSKTAQAVKDFQLVNGFSQDGVAGPQTLESLFSRWCKSNSTVYKTSAGKVYHSDPKCSGMKSPQTLTLVEAVRQNLDPCAHCH